MIKLTKLSPYTGGVVAPSPNHDDRKAPAIEGIVLHATQDSGHEAETLSWLRSPKSRVSCHLLVGRDGAVTRLVGDQRRAWHAGQSSWRGTSDVNSVTLGIEIANRNDGEPYTDAQYRRVAEIAAHYCRQGLSLNDVVSHGEIARERRSDPLGWNWDRFRKLVREQLRSAYAANRGATPVPRDGLSGAPNATPHVVAPSEQRSPAHASKPAFRSRTLWLNGLMVIAASAAILGDTLQLALWARLPVPEQVVLWVLFGVGVVNILLRFQTTCPLGCRPAVEGSAPQPAIAVPRRAPARDSRGVAAWADGSRS